MTLPFLGPVLGCEAAHLRGHLFEGRGGVVQELKGLVGILASRAQLGSLLVQAQPQDGQLAG